MGAVLLLHHGVGVVRHLLDQLVKVVEALVLLLLEGLPR
jgi:hypothetical protein